jgi:hypothetical protein
MTPDDYLNASIVIKANKTKAYEANGNYDLTPEIVTHIKETLERRSLQLDEEQIKSGWECLSHI